MKYLAPHSAGLSRLKLPTYAASLVLALSSCNPSGQQDPRAALRAQLDPVKTQNDLATLGKISTHSGALKLSQLEKPQAELLLGQVVQILSRTEVYKVKKGDTLEGLVKSRLKSVSIGEDTTPILKSPVNMNLAYSTWEAISFKLSQINPKAGITAGKEIRLPDGPCLRLLAMDAQYPGSLTANLVRCAADPGLLPSGQNMPVESPLLDKFFAK